MRAPLPAMGARPRDGVMPPYWLAHERLFGAQDPEDDWGSRYTARNTLVRELTALGVAFGHYGGCKYGTEAAAAALPSAQVGGARRTQLAFLVLGCTAVVGHEWHCSNI